MANPMNEPLPTSCSVCSNRFALHSAPEDVKRCPYCAEVVWPAARVTNREPLSRLGEYEITGIVNQPAPSVLYDASRDGVRYMLTLIDSADTHYQTVKVVSKDPASRAQFPHMFPDATDQHPALVRIGGYDMVGDVCLVAVEYLDGMTLADWIEADGRVSVPDAVAIVITAAEACQAGDRSVSQGIVPREIHITSDGRVRLTSFAMVMRHFREERSRPPLSYDRTPSAKKLGRMFRGVYQAPEALHAFTRTHEFTDAEREQQDVYALGALLRELVTDQAMPRLSNGVEVIRELRLIPAHEVNPEAPAELSDVIDRMCAFLPEHRYQTFDEAVSVLRNLNLASERIELVKSAAADRDEEADAQSAPSWPERDESFDFRRVSWGMTRDEVEASEAAAPESTPGPALMYSGISGDFQSRVVYQFAEEDGRSVCIGASVQPGDLAALMGWGRRPVERPSTEESELDDELKLLRRVDRTAARERKMEINDRLRAIRSRGRDARSTEERISEMLSDPDDVEQCRRAAAASYNSLKELMQQEYGQPEVEDVPLSDATIFDALEDRGHAVPEEERKDLMVTWWHNEATDVCVRIEPSAFGRRMVAANVRSRRHAHHFSPPDEGE